MNNNTMWFDRPASKWEEVLPIGNGSLGGMIWGTIAREQIGLNQDTLWSGYYHDKNNGTAKKYLEQTRDLIFRGDYVKASKMVEDHLLGEFTENYMFLGNLWIKVAGVSSDGYKVDEEAQAYQYRRELDMQNAKVVVQYKQNEVNYTREYFSSYPDNAIIMKYTVDSEHFQIKCSFDSELQCKVVSDSKNLIIRGQCPEHVDPSYLNTDTPIIWGNRGMKFEARLKVVETDGNVLSKDGLLEVIDATFVVLAFTAVKNNDIDMQYSQLFQRHKMDYAELFNRVDFYLGEQLAMPIDMRLSELRKGKEDPALYALFFQYGRYLLISSSRKGSEPANLQGIWNWQMRAPWSCNYTTNINVQMNYWLADIGALSECFEPYSRFVKELVIEGKKTAKVNFGCRGFCVGHNTDFWRNTNPVGIPYGGEKGVKGSSLYAFFLLSGQWLCQGLWQHYEYNLDVEYLKNTVYPILREAALFCVDWLVLYNGYYVTCPSASPENQFISPNGEGISPMSMGSTIDMTIIREVFEHFRKTCGILGVQDVLLDEIRVKELKLSPFKIGHDRRLQEWFYDFKEAEPGHRHMSHMYGLYPGEMFERDKKLVEACRNTIRSRLLSGGGGTGWSAAWIASLFAVLGDGEQAYQYMQILLTKATENNLWASCPPFQIDANFAGATAIANMLVQDRNGRLKILPALPKAWKDGYITGLRIKQGKVIDISWENSKIKSCQIRIK